jgi:hypothetical protein
MKTAGRNCGEISGRLRMSVRGIGRAGSLHASVSGGGFSRIEEFRSENAG